MCWAVTVVLGAILVDFSNSVQCIEKHMPKMFPGVSKQMKGMLEECACFGHPLLQEAVVLLGVTVGLCD